MERPPSSRESDPLFQDPQNIKRPHLEKGDILAGASVLAGVTHVLIDVPPESERLDESVEDAPLIERHQWEYSDVGEVLNETVFQDAVSTGGIQNTYVDSFKTIFSSEPGTTFYINAKGAVLLTTTLPAGLRLLKQSIGNKRQEVSNASVKNKGKAKKNLLALEGELEKETQKWHNENRKTISSEAITPNSYAELGYPFVATAGLAHGETTEEAITPIQLIMERLNEKTRSDALTKYFDGEERTLYDALTKIAEAYDIPQAVILGIAANESGYDREAQSKAGAKGIFQIKETAYIDAMVYIGSHPSVGKKIRSGLIPPFPQAWKNRFVSAELFCAYYHVVEKRVRDEVEALENRLRTLDAGFPVGTLLPIATINAYNGGPGRISHCIDRFLSLSDEEILARIGPAPYGVDVWLSVVGLSFGLKIKGKSTGVGPDTFFYPQKVLAMGSLIMDEENHVSLYDREREDTEEVAPIRRGFWKGLALLTGIGAMETGGIAGNQMRQELPKSLSRRDVLKASAISFGALSPILRIGSRWSLPDSSSSEVVASPTLEWEKGHESVVTSARESLDVLHRELMERVKGKSGKSGWTSSELSRIREFTAPKNRTMLKRRFEDMLGRDLFNRFETSVRQPFSKRKPLYYEAETRQARFIHQKIEDGSFVALLEDDASKPYFCEQVGSLSGTKNDSEALYVRKEFEPLLQMVIELVNYQVDAFNTDPLLYGVKSAIFPSLPHISAVKISGALRSVQSTRMMFEKGQGKRTTPGATPHWLGHALDIGSFATAGSHMVSMNGDLRETQKGPVAIKKGKLPSRGFGKQTREIYSKMIGRGLFAIIEPLKREQGIEIQPLWEGEQLNWHIALDVKE